MSNLKYKYILFDNDGTIADTYNAIMTSFDYAMNKLFGKCTEQDNKLFSSMMGMPLEDQAKKITKDPEEQKEFCKLYRENNTDQLDKLIVNFEGLPEVLKVLNEYGYKLGVVTSKLHKLTLKGLQQLGIDPYFDYLQGADDWPVHKPDPGAITHALDALGLKQSEAVYIGDSPYDMNSGNGAGVDTIAVTWGPYDKLQLQKCNPTYIISKPSQLKEMLCKDI